MIEHAGVEDSGEVYKLICELEQEELPHESFLNNYREGLSHPDIYFFVYRHNKVIGFISFYIKNYLHHVTSTGEIVELVVGDLKLVIIYWNM